MENQHSTILWWEKIANPIHQHVCSGLSYLWASFLECKHISVSDSAAAVLHYINIHGICLFFENESSNQRSFLSFIKTRLFTQNTTCTDFVQLHPQPEDSFLYGVVVPRSVDKMSVKPLLNCAQSSTKANRAVHRETHSDGSHENFKGSHWVYSTNTKPAVWKQT